VGTEGSSVRRVRQVGEARTVPVRSGVLVALAALTVAVGHGFGRLSYPFLLPAMVDDVVGTYGRAGLLGTANLGAYLLGLLVMIRLSGRVPLADFLRVGLLGVVAGLALLSVAPGYPGLVLGMLLAGGFNGALWVPASALAASAVSPRHRGLASGALGVGSGLAIVLAGGLSRGLDNWRTVWAVEAALGAVVLVVVLLRLPRVALEEPVRTGLGLGALRHLPGWAPLVVTYASFAAGYVLFTSYLVAALRDGAGFSASAAAGAYSVLGVASVVGGLLVGRLSDLVGRRRVLLGSHLLMAAASGAVLLGSPPLALTAAAVFGLSSTGLPAVVAAYVADHLEAASVAAAFGVVTIAFGVTQTVAPSLGGFLADATGGFGWTFAVAAAAHAIGALAAFLLPRSR
jgi:predicted MFS family arabinose efflux permease